MSEDFTILFCTLAGSIVGAWIGAYLHARASEAGRIAAVTRAFTTLLSQHEERAKVEERGKRMATHEDIENVLREVKLITAEAEAIKARIGGEEQDRQLLRQEKRSSYGDAIRIFSDLAHYGAIGLVALQTGDPADKTTAVVKIKDLYAELLSVDSLIQIFGSEEAQNAVSHFSAHLKFQDSLVANVEWFRHIQKLAAECKAKVIIAARKDFGVVSSDQPEKAC